MKRRNEVADGWFTVFVVLTFLLAVGNFIAFGHIFKDHHAADGVYGLQAHDSFSVIAGAAGAMAMVIVWLPVIAIFDYLRRGQPVL